MTSYLVTLFGLVIAVLAVLSKQHAILLLPVVLPFEKLFLNTGITGLNVLTLILIPLLIQIVLGGRTALDRVPAKINMSRPILLLMLSTVVASFTPLLLRRAEYYDLVYQITEMKRWFSYFLIFYIYAYGARTREDIKSIVFTIALGYTFEALHAFKDLVMVGRVRLYGSLANPNELGAYLSIFWVANWILMGSDEVSKPRKWFLILGTVVGFVCTIRTLSRGAFLSLLVALFVYAYFRSKKAFLAIILITVVGVYNYEAILPQVMVDRINQTFQEEDNFYGDQQQTSLEQESAGARILFWKAGLKMFLDNPVFGVGFHQFPHHLPKYGQEYGLDNPRPPHNMYIKMLAEQGIFGFIFFVWILISGLRSGAYLRRSTDLFAQRVGTAVCILVPAYSVSMVFGDRFFFGASVGTFFVLYGLVYKLMKLQANTNTSTTG